LENEVAEIPSLQTPGPILEISKDPFGKRMKEFPWWFVAIILIAIWAAFIIFSRNYLFTTSVEFAIASDIDQISDSEANQISEQLREAFAEEDFPLSEGVVLEVKTLDQKWRILDDETTYFLFRDGDELDIFQRGRFYFNKELLFTTKTEFVNTSQISEQLKEAFEKQEVSLSKNAFIMIQRPDQKWRIVDGLSAYYLVRDGGNLEIFQRGSYGDAFDFIKIGLSTTFRTALWAYFFALIFGLLAGLGRISNNIILNNLSRLYVELIRGIPMLVLIFFIALVGVPLVVDGLNSFGIWLGENGLGTIATPLTSMTNQAIPMNIRAIIALAVTYGAFLAEIFRAGIQSITRGQMEAARSLGMSNAQAMRYVILPQAIRNVLPALGNDFVAMVKDSSLVSVLAVRDISQVARLYSGSTFRFREAYVTLTVMYLTLTVVLSLLVQVIERRMRTHD
jgi:polar amino acid transport system permease protein